PGRPPAEFGVRFCSGAAAAAAGKADEALSLYAAAVEYARGADRIDLDAGDRALRESVASAAVAEAEKAIAAFKFKDANDRLDRAFAMIADYEPAKKLRRRMETLNRIPEGAILVREGKFTFGAGAGAREAVDCA